MRFPSIAAVAEALRNAKPWIDGETDVRLQVYEDGQWVVRTGDSSYDLDHRGYWGASFLDRRSNCREIARDLIEQVKDHHAQCQ